MMKRRGRDSRGVTRGTKKIKGWRRGGKERREDESKVGKRGRLLSLFLDLQEVKEICGGEIMGESDCTYTRL